MKRKNLWIWIAVHLVLLLGILLFPYYQRWMTGRFLILSGCIMHDFLHLYCPFCGGTRALAALLHGSVGDAFRFHPLLPLFFFAGILYDGMTFYRILTGKKLPVRIPKGVTVTIVAGIVGYWILRNVLLIAFHFDPIGDLLPYWTKGT